MSSYNFNEFSTLSTHTIIIGNQDNLKNVLALSWQFCFVNKRFSTVLAVLFCKQTFSYLKIYLSPQKIITDAHTPLKYLAPFKF